ncbi:aspartate aminotransferase family protein [Croceicoccus sediminis]|uniref:aspartate aminotransferase family protein n=1 Tax=Croceicoccus sediminis TaxID=2571150 RepID=UPI001182326B|nr:aminotransferase class III-fold pyridoxal phosphate-dependent enzyme [Croceicoccus sediminis]
MGQNAPLFYDEPLELVRGEGVWAYDAQGRAYLDCYNNVPHVGHCHPRVVEAIQKQVATLNLNTRYLHPGVVRYSEELAATVAIDDAAVMLTCTGTEANELALRLAEHHTGARGVIVSDFSYHGNSRQLAALTSCFETPEPFPDRARAIPVPDPFRDRQGRDDETLANAYAAHVEAAVASLQAAGHGVSAMLVDASFANEGLPDIVPGFLAKAVEIVRKAGGLVIFDEVQAGFGRTGRAMWSHQLHDIAPDIVTMGKPMGNGFPVAGMIAPRDMIDRFGAKANYFNTFGGNPVAAAAAQAVLDVLREESLLEQAGTVSAHVVAGLDALCEKYPAVANVRSRGMFFGLELTKPDADRTPDPAMAKRIVEGMKAEGVLMGRIGRHDNVLKLRPAMIFETEHADILLGRLDRVLGALS